MRAKLRFTRQIFYLWIGIIFFSSPYERRVAGDALNRLFKLLIDMAQDELRGEQKKGII